MSRLHWRQNVAGSGDNLSGSRRQQIVTSVDEP